MMSLRSDRPRLNPDFAFSSCYRLLFLPEPQFSICKREVVMPIHRIVEIKLAEINFESINVSFIPHIRPCSSCILHL